jgi:hypothetical protein
VATDDTHTTVSVDLLASTQAGVIAVEASAVFAIPVSPANVG